MRILLLYPNMPYEIIGWGDLGAIAEPIALEYIGAAAREEGHLVDILDLRLHAERLELMLYMHRPDVVGITGYSMHVLRNLELCSIVRKIVPKCKTVIGGHHATLCPEDYFESQVDYVVVGEGVHPFTSILRLIAGTRPPGSIPGVWQRVPEALSNIAFPQPARMMGHGSGSVQGSRSRLGAEFEFGGPSSQFNIDDLPLPDRSLVEEDRSSYYIDWMRPIALMRTSVGCPFRCSFCSLWKIMDGHYYKRDVERIVEELQTIQEPYVFLVDDEPFVNARRMYEVAEGIKRAGIKKEYHAYCRIDSFLRDRDLMQTWHRIGLRRVFFGVEAVLDHELHKYNKRQAKSQILAALQAAREIGIKVFANFIIDPLYDEREFSQVVDFIKTNKVEYPSFTVLTPIPGTAALTSFDHITSMQLNGRPNWQYFDLQHSVTKTTLPEDRFRKEYFNLFRAFSDQYISASHPFYLEMQRRANAQGVGHSPLSDSEFHKPLPPIPLSRRFPLPC